ncbi:Type I restriction-modification system methyltransferase subunit [Reticulomyxa filosa]|uniref:site-specific DNA-methyltransferase (adenine-specific) n=1 Tax=Reticulomyxa filosa TaxID=46433 RepID=X6MRK3_RETFI|nr:Type I restriction-modification system methyltransferase subunit [Reticulomyxa filosa]|eukprot:ETO16291.1 Type I restriction-modification system methyltransferase subunit [Reticulomyxa filosa]
MKHNVLLQSCLCGRFSEFANILFLKLLSEGNEKSWWSDIKSQSNDYIINEIDPLVLSSIDSDIKGDAFEYFLEKTTSTENDLGEYFTPRNVVKTIINLVDPKFKETVYDPFCGTGGFLTESFNYIKENNIIEGEEDLKRLKQETIYGREVTATARIAKMNMILHGDGHAGIQQINTLSNPDYIEKKGGKWIFVKLQINQVIKRMPFIIQRIQTDRGQEFFAYNVQEKLKEYKIKFRPIKPASPHLNGKYSHLMDKLHTWEKYYNKGRPHSALQGKTPWEKYKELEPQIPTIEEVHLNYEVSQENFVPQSYNVHKNIQDIKRGKSYN